MSAALKQPAVVATETHDPSVLDQILDQVNTIAVQQSRPSPVRLQTWEEIERFAEKAARSGMVPKDYLNKPDAIVIAVMMGAELGLAPMQSLQNIAVINGRPSIWGDAMPGLIRASGKCAYIKEWSEGEGDALTFYCEARRKDDPTPSVGRFGVAEAKKAGLWGKDLYAKYPQRMLLARARGFGLRDAFPDVLKGLISAEEARDMVPFEATGLTIRPDPEQVMQPTEQPKKARTWGDFLNELDGDLANAQTGPEVDAILARDSIQKAQDTLQNGARDRLRHMIDEAIKRTSGPAKTRAQIDLEAALTRTAQRTAEDPPLMEGEAEIDNAPENAAAQ